MSGDELTYVDSELLEEILEYEESIKPKGLRRKKPYPSSRDVAEAIIEAVAMFYGHPDDFPGFVLELLESKGFDVRHVTVKRIWRLYEELVRRRVIGDRLGVVLGY